MNEVDEVDVMDVMSEMIEMIEWADSEIYSKCEMNSSNIGY